LTAKEVSKEMVLERKLELLYKLLAGKVPEKLPKELEAYEKEFGQFKKSVEGCSDCFAVVFLDALRVFRDALLKDL
jgi:hypothetical protein